MELIDLSRELYHRAPAHPSHPPVIITTWNDHSEPWTAGSATSSSHALSIAFSDHAGTHVDAPKHFDPRPNAKSIDQMPLEDFYTSAFCVDLSETPLKHAVTVEELKAAVAKTGETIQPKDTVLIYLATVEKLYGTPGFAHDFAGLSVEAIGWLADQGIGIFGVEAVSPSPAGEENVKAHKACGELGITHIEGLTNLDKLVGRGRFRFIGFPLKIRGGTAGPMRAVALFA